jgi:hypothetical protein
MIRIRVANILPPRPRCAPPTHYAFDIDIYDCPCGHMYGDHEYRSISGNLEIVRCVTCEISGGSLE